MKTAKQYAQHCRNTYDNDRAIAAQVDSANEPYRKLIDLACPELEQDGPVWQAVHANIADEF